VSNPSPRKCTQYSFSVAIINHAKIWSPSLYNAFAFYYLISLGPSFVLRPQSASISQNKWPSPAFIWINRWKYDSHILIFTNLDRKQEDKNPEVSVGKHFANESAFNLSRTSFHFCHCRSQVLTLRWSFELILVLWLSLYSGYEKWTCVSARRPAILTQVFRDFLHHFRKIPGTVH
jgi:hypothetical protein